jgi:transposase InsO family protein
MMQKMGLRALIRAKKRSRRVQGMNDAHVPNVLQRNFCATAPDQKWVTDVTEFNVNGQKLYPAPRWPPEWLRADAADHRVVQSQSSLDDD